MVRDSFVASHQMCSAEQAAVRDLVEAMPAYDPANIANFNLKSVELASRLPRALASWSAEVRRLSLGLLRGLPISSDLPDTPTRKGQVDDIAMSADALLGLFAACWGEIVTFEGKAITRHIHNVYPAVDEIYGQLGASANPLDWHVEDGFHPGRAEWLVILCLRGDPDVLTHVARAQDLLLSHNDWLQMRNHPITMLVDDSFIDRFRGNPFDVAMVTGPDTEREISFDPPYSNLQDEDESALVERISVAADRAKMTFSLKAGDLLVINNRRAIHARGPISPRFDGSDRWIKRALVATRGGAHRYVSEGTIAFPESLKVT